MFLQAEAGTERWVQWARKKAADLDAARRALGLPYRAKAYVPEAGTLVWIKASDLGASIHITGNSEEVRYWDDTFTPSERSGSPEQSWHTRAGAIVDDEDYQPAEWSHNFKTFLRAGPGGDVVASRADMETTISDVSPLFHPSPASFFRTTLASVSPKGEFVVALPNTPSATRVARAAAWTGAEWDAFDVPFPVAASGSTNIGAATSSSGYYTASSDQGVTISFPAPGAFDFTFSTPGMSWRAHVNPYKVDSLYLELCYWTTVLDGLIASEPEPPGGWPFGNGGVYAATHTPHNGLWRFDFAARAWAQEFVAPDAGHHTAFFLVLHNDGISWGDRTSGTLGTTPSWGNPEAGSAQDCDFPYWMPSFSPADVRTAVIDNRVDGATRTSAATMALDGAPWIALTGVSTADQTSPVPLEAAGDFVPVQRGSDLRGALSDGTWRYDADGNTVVLTGDRLYSKTMRYAAADLVVHKDGVEAATWGDVDPAIRLASFKNDGQFLASRTETVIVPPTPPQVYHGQGGTLSIDGSPSDVSAFGTAALSLDGASLVIVLGGELLTFSAAELEALLGVPVVFIPNGVPLDLEYGGSDETEVDAARLHVVKLNSTADELAVASTVPLTVAGHEFPADQAVPNAFVIS